MRHRRYCWLVGTVGSAARPSVATPTSGGRPALAVVAQGLNRLPAGRSRTARGTSSISFPRVALRMKKLITLGYYW